jgi:hypothetical protein
MSVVAAGLAAAGGVLSAGIGANAAGNAASQQVGEENQALNYQKGVAAPYINAGNQSLTQLQNGFSNGTFGTPATFTAPTAAQAEAMPGYQFSLAQGDQGLLQGAAAAGGNISGGTLKALDSYNSGLASTTYGNTFNQALNTYQANLAGQNQAFSQLFGTAQLGANAATNSASQVGNTLTNIGNSQAAGTIGTANAINSGIAGATNAATSGITLSQLGQILNQNQFSTPQATSTGAANLGLTSPASSFSPSLTQTAQPGYLPLPVTSNDYATLPG